MRIHLIAIGGAIMHQIAITSARKGHHVTGSDDVIQEPSKSRLQNAGILPQNVGFFSENITPDIDLVILGMHAKFDNPELTKAMELGLKVLSFPEYIYENSIQKKRVVIAGSHGKTSITSMIMHCLKQNQIDFDYLVGSSVDGFEYSVKLSDAPIIVIEGDEYLASPITKEPKFIYYKANIAILSGIEWDHINVFKSKEIYDEQFKKLVRSMDENSKLFYYEDKHIEDLISNLREDVSLQAYQAIDYYIENEIFYARTEQGDIPLSIFGKHNMENIQAARYICTELGINEVNFWKSIASFHGAGRRLELIVEDKIKVIFKDFAHSPSKLKATVDAVKEKYKDRLVIACFEMHTYSTLTTEFLPQYQDSMIRADIAIVFIDRTVVEKKGNQVFTEEDIKKNFNREDILYITDLNVLKKILDEKIVLSPIYLMMSSGTFGGLDLKEIGNLTTSIPMTLDLNGKQEFNSKEIKEEVLTLYSTKDLDSNEFRKSKIMFALSYILFIISPIVFYFLKKDKRSDNFYNIITVCFNFQCISTLIMILGICLSQYLSFLFLIGFIFNIIYTGKALTQLFFKQPINIPQLAMIMIPKIDKA